MRYPLITLSVFIFSACSSQANHTDHQGKNAEPLPLTLEAQSTGNDIGVVIRNGDEVFTDYGVTHTKELHLIAVRDDLRHFAHLHPTRDDQGVWRTAFTPPAGGTYRMYADFADKNGQQYTLPFVRVYDQPTGAYGIVKDRTKSKTIGGYTFTFRTEETPDNALMLLYLIKNSNGKIITPQEYLGEKGHSVLLAPDGTYLHTHPVEMTGVLPREYVGTIAFAITPKRAGHYRVFTQFQIDGKVLTVPFDIGNES
jgi:hypothetical protein